MPWVPVPRCGPPCKRNTTFGRQNKSLGRKWCHSVNPRQREAQGTAVTAKATDLELGSDHSGTNFHLQRALDGREDRRNVIHRRISRSRKHAMQTFGRLVKLTV